MSSRILKSTYATIGLIVSLLFITACSTGFAEKKIAELGYAESDNPESIFPGQISNLSGAQIASQIHETLFHINTETQQIEPAIVEKWVNSTDNSQYVFYLRDSVFFHKSDVFGSLQTRKLVALDVIESIKHYIWSCKIQNRPLGFLSEVKGVQEFYDSCSKQKMATESIEGIVSMNDLIVRFDLDNPSNLFLYGFANIDLAIMPQEALREYGSENLIGCGKYSIQKHDMSDDEWILKANPLYSLGDGKMPYFDQVKIYFNLSLDRELQLFSNGTLSFVQNIAQDHVNRFMEQNVDRFQKINPDFVIIQRPGQENSDLFFMCESSLLGLDFNTFGIIDFSVLSLKEEEHSEQ
ncbi:MAG: ABC transporter substrate-binding protein [Salinivirgaceae bacterium]|nr:ABC transporter substrate-binding protein [Salinivirgaceae bacterium]